MTTESGFDTPEGFPNCQVPEIDWWRCYLQKISGWMGNWLTDSRVYLIDDDLHSWPYLPYKPYKTEYILDWR
jgi:hypothetical protein